MINVLIFIIFINNVYGQSDEQKLKAKEYYLQAEKLYEQEKYEDAMVMYKMADKLYPVSVNSYNIAKCLEKLSRYKEAIKFYEEYIERYKKEKGTLPPDIKDIKNTIEFLKMKLQKQAPFVNIDSIPRGAFVFINTKKKTVGQTPLKLRLKKGEYTIILSKEGYHDFKKKIEVSGEEPLNFTFKLDKILNLGAIKFKVNIKGARIYLDGKVIGLTPMDVFKNIEAGEHQVVIEKENYNSVRKTVKVESGKTTVVTGFLYLKNPPSSFRTPVGILSITLGVLSVGAGGVFYYLANREYNTTDKFKKYQFYQNTGYITGGVLIGAGIGLLIWEATRKVVNEKDLITSTKKFNLSPFSLTINF